MWQRPAAVVMESGPEQVPGLCPVLPFMELSSCPALYPGPTRPLLPRSTLPVRRESSMERKRFTLGLGLERGFEPRSTASKD